MPRGRKSLRRPRTCWELYLASLSGRRLISETLLTPGLVDHERDAVG